MHLIWRRYARSGYAPPWFYIAVGAGFAALAVWALVRGDWLVAGVAIAMIAVAGAGSRLVRRFGAALAASQGRPSLPEETHDQ